MDILLSWLGLAAAAFATIGFIRGAVKSFQRHWFYALALLVFVPPAWVIWSIVEIFTDDIPTDRSLNGERAGRRPRASFRKTAVATGASAVGGFAIGRKIGKKMM